MATSGGSWSGVFKVSVQGGQEVSGRSEGPLAPERGAEMVRTSQSQRLRPWRRRVWTAVRLRSKKVLPAAL